MEAPFLVPPKRARAPPNNSSSQVALCMVDGCNSDLSKCREYYRRHKVCELHSKTPKVTIRGQEQRFCQQCSRFHSLVEFDDVKRSCRKRLDGHNRRRRKPPQPDTSSSINSSSSSSSTHYFLSNSNYQVAKYVNSTAFLSSGVGGSSCSWSAAPPENRAAELVRSDKKVDSFPLGGGGGALLLKGGQNQIHLPNFLQGAPPFLGRVSCGRALSLLSPPLPHAEAEASSRKKVESPPPPPDHKFNASLASQLGGSSTANATSSSANMLVSSSQEMMFQVRRRRHDDDDDDSSGCGSRPLPHHTPSFSWE